MYLGRVRRLPAPAQLLLLVAAAEGSGEARLILAAGSRLGLSPADLVRVRHTLRQLVNVKGD